MGITNFYIFVFTNWLTKIYYYKPTITLEAKKAAQTFVQTVFRLYGFQKAIVSNQDFQFISKFLKYLTS